MDEIILVCRQAFCYDGISYHRVSCDIHKDSLLDLCRYVIGAGHRISFDAYYGESFDMAIRERFPYIECDGRIIWNVPYSEVTVAEFLDTHGIEHNRIYVDVDNVGGALDEFARTLYQGWLCLKPVMDVLGYISTVVWIVSCVRKGFGKAKEEKPSVSELKEFIMQKDKWDLSKLSVQLNADESFVKILLETFGYEEHEGIYWKNHWKVEQFNRASNRIDEALYDNHGTEVNCYSLNDLVSGINMSLLYLDIICKEVNEAATYQQVVDNIKEEIEDFTQYISYHSVKNAVMLKEQFEDFSMETESELMFLLSKLKNELDEQVLVMESRISN